MSFQEIEARFRQVEHEYDSLKETCEAQVIQWRWATSWMLSIEPYWFERNHFSRGRWLKAEPADKWTRSIHQYGLDCAQRVVIERSGFPHPQQPPILRHLRDEDFHLYGDCFIEKLSFGFYGFERRLKHLARLSCDNGKPLHLEECSELRDAANRTWYL